MSHLFFQLRLAKDDHTSQEAMQQIFSSLLPSHVGVLKRLIFGSPKTYGFEIYLLNQTICFYVVVPKSHGTLVRDLFNSAYPKASLIQTSDPLDIVRKSKLVLPAELTLTKKYHFQLRTFGELGEVDPLSHLVDHLLKQGSDIRVCIQILVSPAHFNWRTHVLRGGRPVTDSAANGARKKHTANQSSLFQKASLPGGKTAVRVLIGTDNLSSGRNCLDSILSEITNNFEALEGVEGNRFLCRRIILTKNQFLEKMKLRRTTFFERRTQILNAAELATIWHPLNISMPNINNGIKGKKLAGQSPKTLLSAVQMGDDERKRTNFFAKYECNNQEHVFGIKEADRRRHIYIIGKAGAGKSTLIANMAINDIRQDRGIGVIDPCGDLSEMILKRIPKRRVGDVVYLKPSDSARSFALNVFEVKNTQHRELVCSEIVAIFDKQCAKDWGPRVEYVLRNTILTLFEIPHTTLSDAIRLLTNKTWRDEKLMLVRDEVLVNFWKREFDTYTTRLRAEVISPIQSKIGQFVRSKMIRTIMSQTTSIDFQKIMDDGKILVLNLDQRKLGNDSAALLGMMIITQIQLAAMNRAHTKKTDQSDFFLYIDEFQNFATPSFIKILSEARKNRLALTVANRHIERSSQEIHQAIFGSVGTLIGFTLSDQDAQIFSEEFAELYKPTDIANLGKYEIILKLCIDGITSAPFLAKTLPLPGRSSNDT